MLERVYSESVRDNLSVVRRRLRVLRTTRDLSSSLRASFRRQKENPGAQGRGSSPSQLPVGNVGVAFALRALATLRPVLRTVRAVLRPVLRVARATLRPVLRAVRAVLRAVRLVVAIVFLPFGIDVTALPPLTFCTLFLRSGQVNTLFVFCPA